MNVTIDDVVVNLDKINIKLNVLITVFILCLHSIPTYIYKRIAATNECLYKHKQNDVLNFVAYFTFRIK